MAQISIKLGNITSSNDIKNTKNYVYKDIDITFGKNTYSTDIKDHTDLAAIYESLANILTYRRGERILNTEFGLNLRDYLYEPISDTTAESIGMSLINSIKKYEQRITISNIDVIPIYDENQYNVSIYFSCKKINPSEQQIYEFPIRLKNINRF